MASKFMQKAKRRIRAHGSTRTTTGIIPKRGRPKLEIPEDMQFRTLEKYEQLYLDLLDRWLGEAGKTLRCVAKSRRIPKTVKGRYALAEACAAYDVAKAKERDGVV